MLTCFTHQKTPTTLPIFLVAQADITGWIAEQTTFVQNWLTTSGYQAKAGQVQCIPNQQGELASVICCVADSHQIWAIGQLPLTLPVGDYYFDDSFSAFSANAKSLMPLIWGLGAYQFNRYKIAKRASARLYVVDDEIVRLQQQLEAIYLVRDWINTPTDDLGPTEFAHLVESIAKEQGASFSQIVGNDLLKANYAAIHTVGRASDDPPRLLDLRWGQAHQPKVTLVGKGVCFDSGGLDIKNASNMTLMKKDMGGAAHVLGLALMIMQAKLPICLRVLIPLVENSISGNAYRPGDVIRSRKGITIEIGNTDAEGRVILADALTEAASEHPDLLIDIATLTGAARVALGPDLPVVFSNHDDVVNAVIKHGNIQQDPMWRLPLFSGYREYINSAIADINNNSNEPYAGAITAALFLQEFVPPTIPWLHFDLMAWNITNKPGRPKGGEAMTLRALFDYLVSKFCITS